MDELELRPLSPMRLALAAAHVAGLIMSAHKIKEWTMLRLQTGMALLSMEDFLGYAGSGTRSSMTVVALVSVVKLPVPARSA